MGVRDEQHFEPEFVRSVTRRVRLGRAVRLFIRTVGSLMLVPIYLVAVIIVFGMASDWNSWKTGTHLRTEGIITGKYTEVAGRSLTYVIEYEFVHDGITYTGSDSVGRSRYPVFSIGDAIPIIYVESSPDVNRPDFPQEKEFEFGDYLFFFMFACIVLMPFVATASYLYRRIRGLPTGKDMQTARLQMVCTLTQIAAHPAPRAIFDHWRERRFPEERVRTMVRLWLDWDGRLLSSDLPPEVPDFGTPSAHPAILSILFADHPETLKPYYWLKSQMNRPNIEDFLARVDYVYRRGHRRYRTVEPFDTSVPSRIKGPDDPVLQPEERWSIPEKSEKEFRALEMLRRLTGDPETDPGSFESFRLELNGLDRERAINHIEYVNGELKREASDLKKLRKQSKNRNLIYVTRCGTICKDDYEAFLDRVSPNFGPLYVGRGETEELYATLRIREAVVFVHDLLYFFYCCPWRWNPVVREVELEMQDGSVCPVRFSFIPGEEIRVERL